MKPKLFLLFNHKLTAVQVEDARSSLGVEEIVALPEDLDRTWRRVPPELSEISAYLDPVKEWLSGHAEGGDYLLIQGDFGACYLMVRFAFEKGYVPVYSTTEREAVEEHMAGDAVRLGHIFRHKRFRKYGG